MRTTMKAGDTRRVTRLFALMISLGLLLWSSVASSAPGEADPGVHVLSEINIYDPRLIFPLLDYRERYGDVAASVGVTHVFVFSGGVGYIMPYENPLRADFPSNPVLNFLSLQLVSGISGDTEPVFEGGGQFQANLSERITFTGNITAPFEVSIYVHPQGTTISTGAMYRQSPGVGAGISLDSRVISTTTGRVVAVFQRSESTSVPLSSVEGWATPPSGFWAFHSRSL